MLQIKRFDIKTGKPILETIEGVQQQAVKVVEHSRLEFWLKRHSLNNADFAVARFYQGINDADRQRLEADGKVLVFTNGKDGYFTDADTAQLMASGRDGIEPIYSANADSAHNSVAYGSLITSDGVASTSIENARILVIDNVSRDYGSQPLLDRNGQPIPATALQPLLDKMGDGTMLVQPSLMESLVTPAEHDKMTARAFESADIGADLSTLGSDLQATEAATQNAERALRKQASRRVSQFRAAASAFPGIAKGTMSVSQWTARLGVDAILSTDDIKGDDGQFSKPGIKTVESFWVNRKSDARYAQQAVGPQVKYNAPEATRLEINPKGKTQAEALAKVAGDPVALSQYYVAQKEKDYERPVTYDELDSLSAREQRTDWLYDVLSADRYYQTVGMAQVVRPLNRYVRGEWLTHATHATSVPSAMAQHHSQLRPWEVCNKDLPHGAIVAYYRSPLPNVGALTLAINNTEVIRQQDSEAFDKQGVAYLPPSTAKEIAITDFDGDANGFFVGYCATVEDLPEQVRKTLGDGSGQYEAGRALLEQMMQRCDEGKERRLKPSTHPLAVKEFAAANAPGQRPPTVIKQAKEKHQQKLDEGRSAAVWRAWEKTAENPIGKVANAGMTLQSLALELRYAPEEQKEALLIQVSARCQSLLRWNAEGKIDIPSDKWLQHQVLPEYGFRERITKLAEAESWLKEYPGHSNREEYVERGLQYASALLMDAGNGPNAFNLQTAVDAAKSSRGIDENIHRFVVALQHKPDELRRYRKDQTNYRDGQSLPTNTQEPIAWGVEAVNEIYQAAQTQQLEENLHRHYQSILPNAGTPQQEQRREAIAQTYNNLISAAVKNKARLSERRLEDQQPTVRVATADGRRSLVLQNISDEHDQLNIWRADGSHPGWKITVSTDITAQRAGQRFPAYLHASGEGRLLGYVSPESVAEHGLEERLQGAGQALSIIAPTVLTQVPFAQQNDAPQLFEQADWYIQDALATPSNQDATTYRAQFASALWRHHDSRHIVLKHFSAVLSDRLQQLPNITLNNMKYAGVEPAELIADGPRTIQFGINTFVDNQGKEQSYRSISVVEPDGELKHIGTISRESISLPLGATYMAAFTQNPKSDRVVDMQVMELPTVEQTPAELIAFAEGRTHLTFENEPYAVYGVREGDIFVAQAEGSDEQVALRVKDQHQITKHMVERADGPQRWASAEHAPAEQLPQRFADAHSAGKQMWGLNVEPLGIYERGQITPFPTVEQETAQEPLSLAAALQSLMSSSEPTVGCSSNHGLWQRYNTSSKGVMAGVSGVSGMQRRLDQEMAMKALSDGHSVAEVQQAISQNSPAAQQSPDPEKYAQGVLEKAAPTLTAKLVANQKKQRSAPRQMVRTRKKNVEMGY